MRGWLRNGTVPQDAVLHVTAIEVLVLGVLLNNRNADLAAGYQTVLSIDGVGAIQMESFRDRNRPGFGYHLKVHTFRTLTAVLAWVLVAAAFYQKPELLTSAQRLMQRGIEAVGDAVPSPWGARMEFVFREIGGLIWLQITMVILTLRMMLSTIAAAWRLIFRAKGPRSRWGMNDHVALAIYATLTLAFILLLILVLPE